MATSDIVTENMPLVYGLIRKYYPSWIGDEDVIQAGMLGLCKAAKKYDETLGKFSTYAAPAILNSIRREFINIAKHNKDISLNTVIAEDSYDGDTVTLEDILSGDDDIDFIDMDGCLSKLDEREKQVIELRQLGYTMHEIGDKLGVSRQTACDICRRIKIKWSKVI